MNPPESTGLDLFPTCPCLEPLKRTATWIYIVKSNASPCPWKSVAGMLPESEVAIAKSAHHANVFHEQEM